LLSQVRQMREQVAEHAASTEEKQHLENQLQELRARAGGNESGVASALTSKSTKEVRP
jgi:hypothetical protein